MHAFYITLWQLSVTPAITKRNFTLTLSDSCKSVGTLTKRSLMSEIESIFDVIGWCWPTIIKPKIMLQDIWKEKADWDHIVPHATCNMWQRWHEELPLLQDHLIPRNFCPKNIDVASVELHEFSDASELAYAGVVYLRTLDVKNCVHVSLVIAKTKVAPLKRLSRFTSYHCYDVGILVKLLYDTFGSACLQSIWQTTATLEMESSFSELTSRRCSLRARGSF